MTTITAWPNLGLTLIVRSQLYGLRSRVEGGAGLIGGAQSHYSFIHWGCGMEKVEDPGFNPIFAFLLWTICFMGGGEPHLGKMASQSTMLVRGKECTRPNGEKSPRGWWSDGVLCCMSRFPAHRCMKGSRCWCSHLGPGASRVFLLCQLSILTYCPTLIKAPPPPPAEASCVQSWVSSDFPTLLAAPVGLLFSFHAQEQRSAAI